MTARVSIPLRDPRTGADDGAMEAATRDDVGAAAAALRACQPAWAALPIAARAQMLLQLKASIEAQRDAIAIALERDTGRRALAKLEVAGVCASLGGWAAQADHLIAQDWREGRSIPHVKHRPQFIAYPLVGVISPWNYPLTLAMIDTIPALLAGCAVLLKPSEVTPRFVAPLQRAIAAVPELSSVFGIIQGGAETGAALVDSVDAICFTGSLATGKKVAVQAASRLIPAFLELGGKDPLIVMAGANIDDAVTAALRGSVLGTGQACQSIERIYVQRPLYADFVDRLAAAAAAVRVNWPSIATGDIGPIIFAKQADILARQIEDAKAKGARVLTGGEIETHGGGLWLKPTVIVDVTHEMAVMHEETFGPILPVMAFDHEDEAIALANDSAYGLSAAVFAGDIAAAETIALKLEAGAVSLNDAALTALFYEAEKQSFKGSGLGASRMGQQGFHRFLRRKALIANQAKPRPLSSFAEDAGT